MRAEAARRQKQAAADGAVRSFSRDA